MAYRTVEFDVNSLLKLLTHYSEGEIPLESECKQFMVSARLPRWVALIVEAKSWTGTPLATAGYGGTEPYIFRYEGKRTLRLNNRQDEIAWTAPGDVEAPKRQ